MARRFKDRWQKSLALSRSGACSVQCPTAFSIFDFDDTGLRYLAFEFAVYPWVLHPRTVDGVWSDKAIARLGHFFSAYGEARAVAEADLAAIAPFVAVRQIWLLGEYAGRVSTWGSQAMPLDYLQRQVKLLQQWESLELPVACLYPTGV